jgi:serine/threonine protein kinase
LQLQVTAVTQRDNLSGLILANRYEIGELLGTGGFGSTYRALDSARFNTECAVKVLLPARRNDIHAKRLFEREARLLFELSHKQIPTLHAYFAEEERYYLVQDLVRGETLKDRLRQTRLGEAEVLSLISRTLDVLEYLHDRVPPVIHRDIKPANIILGDNGVTYLIDFGAVREVLSVDESATAIGTPGYTPREQMNGHARPSSDLYALGATALEAISGQRPVEWHDRTTESINFQGRLECSPQFERILSGLLADIPKRFTSAAHVRAAIESEYGIGATSARAVAASMPTPAAPATNAEPAVMVPNPVVNTDEAQHIEPSLEAPLTAHDDTATASRDRSAWGRKVLLATTAGLTLIVVFLLGQMVVNSRTASNNAASTPTQTPAADTTSAVKPSPANAGANPADTASPVAPARSAASTSDSSTRQNAASNAVATPVTKRPDTSKSATEPTSAAVCALLNERLALGEAISNADREKLRKCR